MHHTCSGHHRAPSKRTPWVSTTRMRLDAFNRTCVFAPKRLTTSIASPFSSDCFFILHRPGVRTSVKLRRGKGWESHRQTRTTKQLNIYPLIYRSRSFVSFAAGISSFVASFLLTEVLTTVMRAAKDRCRELGARRSGGSSCFPGILPSFSVLDMPFSTLVVL